AGQGGNARSHNSSSSANGRYVAFETAATNLGATAPGELIFVRDTCFEAPAGCAPSTTLVSANSAGTPADFTSVSLAISANGRFVAFISLASNLPRTDVLKHAYMRDTCTGATACTPTTTLVSNLEALDLNISADGRYVAYAANTTSGGATTTQVFV